MAQHQRTWVALTVAATLGAGLSGLGAHSADAAGACAKKAEYSKVETGMGYRKVKRIFGGAPTTLQDNGAGYMAAGWKKCGTTSEQGELDGGACITFEQRKVWLKSWHGNVTFYCVAPGGPS